MNVSIMFCTTVNLGNFSKDRESLCTVPEQEKKYSNGEFNDYVSKNPRKHAMCKRPATEGLTFYQLIRKASELQYAIISF